MDKEKIALVSFGRSHWLKLPQLGLVILCNKINSLQNYSSEIFDYGEVPIYSMGGDHFSIIHYNSFNRKYPVGFIPEIPILDLLFKDIKKLSNEDELSLEYVKEQILFNKDKHNFILDFCKKIGHNPYLFLECIERIFKILPKIFKDLYDYKYIGFFNHTANFFGVLIVSEVLRILGKKITFGGGPQITTFFDNLKYIVNSGLFYDYIVKGDAENYIAQILDEIIHQKAKFFDCSKNKDLQIIEKIDLDYNFDCVLDKGYKYHHLIFDLSRGCPARCTFCGEYKIHGRTALKEPKKAAEHLVELTLRYETYPDFIPLWRIGDSLINFDENFLNKFLDQLIELKKKSKSLYVKGLSFYGYARGNLSLEMTNKLKKAGCRTLWVGVESFSNEFLKYYNKQLSIEDITKSIINILKSKITVGLLLITPSNAIIDIPKNYLYNEIIGIKRFIKKVLANVEFLRIESGPFPFDQQVFIAAHTMLTMIGNSSLHNKFPIENWELTDFYNLKENIYRDLPRNYILKTNMKQTIRDYYHKDQILRKLFPINKDSKVERLDEILEFSSIGSQAKCLKTFEHNILNTLDYFSMKKDSDLSMKDIRNYLIKKAWE